MATKRYRLTGLRTGITEDGLLEMQLIYGNNGSRGGSVWFEFTREMVNKLDKELWGMREKDRASRCEQPQRPREQENGWDWAEV